MQLAVNSSEALDFLFNTGPFAHREPSSFPALILLDLKLPQVSGLSVLEIIKVYARTRVIPIVMIAEPSDTYAISGGYRSGASACILRTADHQKFIRDITHTAHYWLQVNWVASSEGNGNDASAKV